MRATALKLVIRQGNGSSVPPTWAREFQKIEERIRTSDGDALEARWECGRKLLVERRGKLLPKGLLENIGKEISVGRVELQRRVRFAEKYPTSEQLCHAVTQFGSWHQIVKGGLSSRHAKRKTVHRIAPALRRIQKMLHTIKASDVRQDDLAALDAVRREIDRLLNREMSR